jgi:hypothetical protein
MTKGLKLRKGFSFDEAILMANFSKDAYDIFQHDDGTIDDSEIKKIYAALHHNRGWQAVSTIRNDDTNIRGLILKNTQSSYGHQYVISFRGSIVSDLGAVELTDFTADFDWELIRYGSLSNQRAKVVQGFHIAFESVADQIQFFFQTIRGELKASDFRRLNELPPLRKFASITALADAASIRLGAEFEKEVQDLIQQVVADGEVDDDEELKKILKFLEDELLSKLTPLAEPLELWITGHSLGGCLCQLAGLFLRRYFGPEETGGLKLKVYALASPKIGNQGFVDFYNEQVGEELSYRIENTLDGTPKFPYDPPFPLSLIAPEGLRIGNTFIGNYANGGEAFLVTGLGSQSGSLSFGGIVELPISVPFPHSVETYIQLLKEQKHYWYQLIRPIKDIIRPFLLEILKDEEITNVEPSEDVSGLNSHEKSLGNPEASTVD